MQTQTELFYDVEIDELKRGFTDKENKLKCLICGRQFMKGEIYKKEERFYDAYKTAEQHIEEEHESMLNYLLQMNSDTSGISDIQQSILRLMAAGCSDKEIAAQKGIAASTIRNHRFKLREKEKQAKLFLAISELLRAKQQEAAKETANAEIMQSMAAEFCEPHRNAVMRDDRYCITEEERQKVLNTYFDENGALKELPAKEKKKIVVLRVIAANFKSGKIYTEKEVNRLIERIYGDYPYVRRLLIEYGFLERTNAGTEYWAKE